MKLFAVYIGGSHPAAHIELHDMRFVLAESIEGSYDALRQQWWGKPASLHIDCWAELSRADGYRITLEQAPSGSTQKLFYVNLGGYDLSQFTELHRNLFVVAETPALAKAKALKTVKQWDAPHKDDLYEADDLIGVGDLLKGAGWYIHLDPIEDTSPAPFICEYRPIAKKVTR